jgi:peptide deformylase
MAEHIELAGSSNTETHVPKIVQVGDPLIRRAAQPVTAFAAVSDDCKLMIERLRQLQGAGLAANQIGIDKQILVVEVRKTELFPDRPESPLYVMLNASIIWHSQELIQDWEGCFSVPGLVGRVPRFSSIEVLYDTDGGERKQERFDGYVARVLQHEIDHLNGKLYLDRMLSMESLSTRQNYLRHVLGKSVL